MGFQCALRSLRHGVWLLFVIHSVLNIRERERELEGEMWEGVWLCDWEVGKKDERRGFI